MGKLNPLYGKYENLEQVAVIDGQMLFTVDEKGLYFDLLNGETAERMRLNGPVAVSEAEPADEDIKIWINPSEDNVQGVESTLGASALLNVPYAENITIAPNAMHVIEELTGDIELELAPGAIGYDNEWAFQIVQGETAYNIVTPIIKWGLGIAPVFGASTTTLCRLYYIGETLCGEWVTI